jgi:hypothetical protein
LKSIRSLAGPGKLSSFVNVNGPRRRHC